MDYQLPSPLSPPLPKVLQPQAQAGPSVRTPLEPHLFLFAELLPFPKGIPQAVPLAAQENLRVLQKRVRSPHLVQPPSLLPAVGMRRA